ncbi:MAG TPA: serine/threonine-protein kinase [Kofleriaceae bacterium]|jgi:serine/threonine-protein kinase
MATRPSSGTDSSEEGRAFLQNRLALFFKTLFFFMLLATVMGLKGVMKDPGPDLILDAATVVEAGVFWWLCRRGPRSIRFLRILEGGGLFFNFCTAAMLGRYVLVGFTRDQSIVSAEGKLMADAYLSALGLIGITAQLGIRAALVPSSPRRTLVYTALCGLPPIVCSLLIVPSEHGGFILRSASSAAYPWMPATLTMMWAFIVFTCTVISWVMYGLRKEVREARLLGQYVLEKKIGEGGMGEVYRARHGMMRRPSALKLLRPDNAGEGGVARFEREVQLTARLTHPNTITIFDYGRTDDGVFYYAMELLDGSNLQRIVSVTGNQPVGRVVRILSMACSALTEAHGIGLIHRDIKPANIILCTQGGERDVVKLLDFGLVKEMKVDADVNLTGPSTLTGSPQYMAPEAIRAPESVDARTDIYALGAVAYFLLAGTELFNGKSVIEVCSQHLHQEPEPLSARGVEVPPALEAVVLACLAKKPDDRPQSAAELRRRLEACSVDGWDTGHAGAWWNANQGALDADAAQTTSEPRTIAIDGALRLG